MIAAFTAFPKLFLSPADAFRELDEARPTGSALFLCAAAALLNVLIGPAWNGAHAGTLKVLFPWLSNPKAAAAAGVGLSLLMTGLLAVASHAAARMVGGSGSLSRFWTASLYVSAVTSLFQSFLPFPWAWLVVIWGIVLEVVALSVVYEFSLGKAVVSYLAGWALQTVLLVALWAGWVYTAVRGRMKEVNEKKAGHAETAAVNLPADYGWKVLSLDGTEHDMSEAKGATTVLNFWATWCGPCKMEMPSLQRLYDKVKGDGVKFYLVSDEDPATVRAYVEKEKFTVPVYTAKGHPSVYDSDGIPTTFVLSPGGRIVRRQVGSMDWDTEGMVRSLQGAAAADLSKW